MAFPARSAGIDGVEPIPNTPGGMPKQDGSEECDVVRIALGSRFVGPRMGENHGPAVCSRLLGAGARPVRGALPGTDLDAIRASLEENRDGRRMLLQDGALPLDESEGDPRGGGEGGQGRLSPRRNCFGSGRRRARGAGPPVLRGPARKVPAAGPPRERIPPLRDLAEAVEQAIDTNGNVLDRASRNWDPCGGSS